MKVQHALLAFVASFCMWGAIIFAISTCPACKTFQQASKSIEEMPEDQFAFQLARIERITRGLTELAVLEDYLKVEDAMKAAAAIDQAADVLSTPASPDLIRNILEAAGVTDVKVLALAGLVTDLFPSAFNWGTENEFLGPHARAILHGVAGSIRQGSGGQATPAELFEAKEVKQDAK